MRSAVKWMAGNHVAANLLMMIFLVGGFIKLLSIKQEVFPEIALDMIQVNVIYPGAGPEEVEEGIILKVEDNLTSLDGIKEIKSTASEGVGTVIAELLPGEDPEIILQRIKSEVDRIITFPQEAEKPIITKILNRVEVMSLVIYGDASERALREQAEMIREDLLNYPQITQIDLAGVRPYEISIEIPEENLRRYNLTLEQVAGRVRSASLDLPGGTIKTGGGQILLRTKEKRYLGSEYVDIVILSKPDGTRVTLGEIGEIRDTFMETDQITTYGGKPAAMVKVFRVGEQKPKEISELVKRYVEEKRVKLPESILIDVAYDTSELLDSRLSLLKTNAFLGLCLVFLILGLFLRARLAIWVMMGIPISFFGAMLVLPSFGISISMLSLFAFILALGILVDDAIVVGENIFEHRQQGKPYLQAAVDGTLEVAVPVTFSIATTIVAFLPLTAISGMMGKFIKAIPIVVISLLVVSLVESLFILPAHLSMLRKRKSQEDDNGGLLHRIQDTLNHKFKEFTTVHYKHALEICLRNRYVTIAASLAILMLTLGLFKGGIIQFTFMPKVDGDQIEVALELPPGTPVEETARIVDYIEARGVEAVKEFDSRRKDDTSIMRNTLSLVGGTLRTMDPHGAAGGSSASHLAGLLMFLTESEERDLPSTSIENRWRELVGELPGVESLTFTSNLMQMGANIDIQLAHNDYTALEGASERLQKKLAEYPGVFDIKDNYSVGKKELKLRLRPEAVTLGITESSLAHQVRGAFYGSEALRLQIGRNEVKVMVRYPEEERKRLWDLKSMRIRTPSGGEMPIVRAAYMEESRGYSTISRTDRKRVIDVTASVDEKVGNANEIIADLQKNELAELLRDVPGMHYRLMGEGKEQDEAMSSMMGGFLLAMLGIYALLAIPFRSYSQPLLIMTAIPFGVVGAVIGHMIMFKDLSILSLFGVVALSGVVVNDSLLLIDRINNNRRKGSETYKAVIDAGQRRFRPILLTSLTTFFGLMPMILETSVQAQFLIPMAISLGFGILFATTITLLLIPSTYMVLEDILDVIHPNRSVC